MKIRRNTLLAFHGPIIILIQVKRKRGRPKKGTAPKSAEEPSVPKVKKKRGRKKKIVIEDENDDPSFCGECGKHFLTKDNLSRKAHIHTKI